MAVMLLIGALPLFVTLAAVAAVAEGVPTAVFMLAERSDDPLLPEGFASPLLSDTTDVVDSVATTSLGLRIGDGYLRVPYYANRSIFNTHADVTRLVIVLHGTLRNANVYYASTMTAAGMAAATESTLIVAPQYLTEADIVQHDLPPDRLFWSYMGWRQGDLSLSTVEHPRPARISSYAVADSFLVRIAPRLPNLTEVVIAGHSAGGQFLNRYAAGSQVEPVLQDVAIRYIVSNPSSYMYWDTGRWVRDTEWEFEVPPPDTIAACPEYNRYKFGLELPNDYMSIGEALLRENYAARRVVYLLGGYDTDPNSYYLERTCPAMLQGRHRLERGTVYTHHLVDHFGDAIQERHILAYVPGVGHNHTGMFTSPCGLFHLFDFGDCVPPPIPEWDDATTEALRSRFGRSAAWGDVDFDGDFDVFISASDDSDLLVRNDGAGVFTDITSPPLPDSAQGLCAFWGDVDGDGDIDLYTVNFRSSNRLFLNDGKGGFSEATSGPLGADGDFSGAAWIDYDNDGDLDLYLLRINGGRNLLLRNDGVDGFTDVSAPPLDDPGASRGCAWGDYDNDGDLDLYLCNSDTPNRLLRNDGGGVFTDVTAPPLNHAAISSNAAWGDMDNDGDLDLYLVIRGGPNRLFRNDGDGVFTDVTRIPLDDSGFGRSAVWGDYDNDGWLDLYLCNIGGPNRLFRNLGGGDFADATISPLDERGDSWSAVFVDYDADGDLDLYVTNHNAPNRLLQNRAAAADRNWLQIELLGTESNTHGIGAFVRVVAGDKSQVRQIGGDAGALAQGPPLAHFGLDRLTRADSVEVRWPSGKVQKFFYPGINARLTVVESVNPPSPVESGPDPVRPRLSTQPNPFRASTTIEFDLLRSGALSVVVADVAGRVVRTLEFGRIHPAGRHRIVWDGRDDAGRAVASGVYLCRLSSGDWRRTLSVVLVQ